LDDRDWLRLTVEDYGGGIPSDVATRIFDPFFTTKGRSKGTGLGLSISQSIMHEHGGSLSFDSEPGIGTKFYMDLPINSDADHY
jgi:signal transduction histidine kinase